jgi:hypothetical protein
VSAVASPRPRAAPAVGIDRLVHAFPLVASYLALFVVYGWQARGHLTPWLFTDELQLAEFSRSIANTGVSSLRGHAYAHTPSAWAYVIAPFWWIHDVGTAYAAIKYFSVAVMTAAIFPAYLLARLVVGRPAALFAAVATAAIPSLAYSTYLLEEPLAYPWATLALFLVVKALVVRTRGWILAALVVSGLGYFVREEVVLVLVVFGLAALFLFLLGDRMRAWRRRWSVRDWIGAIVLAVGAVILFSGIVGAKSHTWLIATGYYRSDSLRLGAWAVGALMVGVGILPFVIGLATLVPVKGEPRTPELRAFRAVLLASLLAFCVYTGVKASYLASIFATRVEERNLIYLSPLLFVATAMWMERPRLRLVPLALAVGLAAYLIVDTKPYQIDFHLYSDALGLAILQMGNRMLALDADKTMWVLFGALGVSVALLFAPRLAGRWRPAGLVAAGVAAALVVAWNLAGQISAASATNTFSRILLDNYPSPPNWIDQSVGDGKVLYLGQRIADPQGIWLMEFWNRSLQQVWSLDGTAPGPGPTLTPDLAQADGALKPDPKGFDYVVVDPGVNPVGELIGRPKIYLRTDYHKDAYGFVDRTLVFLPAHWRLYRIKHPFRLQSAPVGIFSDGWIGNFSGYSQFATRGNRGGDAIVNVSRAAWKGPDKPARVIVTLGTLVKGPDRQPAIGKVLAVRRWTIHSGQERRFVIPVARPPFRVEVKVTPTFSPSDYGYSDRRQLGAQVSYGFKPGGPAKPSTSG